MVSLPILICCSTTADTPKKLRFPRVTFPEIRTAGIKELKSPMVASCPTVIKPLKILKLPILTLQENKHPEQIIFPLPKDILSLSKKIVSGENILGKSINGFVILFKITSTVLGKPIAITMEREDEKEFNC